MGFLVLMELLSILKTFATETTDRSLFSVHFLVVDIQVASLIKPFTCQSGTLTYYFRGKGKLQVRLFCLIL